jgi:anti-sigma regulatory factor (Ser/Thr protein kinase)
MEMRARLSADPQQVGRARRLLSSKLSDWGVPDDAGDVVVLLTSELVTNAILHGAPPVELVAFPLGDGAGGGVRVEVHDHAAGRVEQPRRTRDDALRGRGLRLVAALASRWGTDQLRGGKSVWFEVEAT